MAFKATHHRRHTQLHDRYVRSDSLLIGPGGEIVAAYGAGDRIPAIPQPVTGRLEHNTQPFDVPTEGVSAAEASATSAPSATNELTGITSATPTASSILASSVSAVTAATATSMVASSALSVATLAATSSDPTSTPTITSTTSTAPSSSSSPTISSSASISAISTTPSSASASSVPTDLSTPTTSSPDHNHRNVYFGIALAAIAAIGLIVVLIVWGYRTRSRTRRANRRRRMLWPWHRNNDDDAEGGLGATKEYPFGQAGSRSEKERVDGELSYPQYPARTLRADEMLRASVHLPALNSPFRPVIPHLQSVPDLTPNLGLLQVANYMPGDVSSEEGSRANSRQGNVPSTGEVRSPAAPWATYGPEDGFQNPWPPLKPRRGLGIRTTSGVSQPVRAAEDGAADPSAIEQMQESWAASIRSSINNAFNAMVGAPAVPGEDNLTRLPDRRATVHDFEEASHETDVRSSNTSVLSNPFGDPPMDLDVTSPCDYPADDAHHDPNCLCEWLKQKQGPTTHGPTLRAPSPDLVHDRPSPRSAYDSPGRAAPTPSPPLPPISVARGSSVSSLHQAIKRKQLQRGRSKKFPPRTTAALDRMHLTPDDPADYAMSREPSTASTLSGPLSDQEQFASTALRERRKRVLNAQRLAARQSLKRPSVRLGSRRQKSTSGPQALGAASALRERMSSL